MGKERTAKCRFESKYATGTFVSDGQYLAELICEKIAAKNKEKLPYKFWAWPVWKNTFLLQLAHANKLLKEFDVFVIIKALKDKRAYKINSLGARFILNPILEDIKKKVETAPVQQTEEEIESPKIRQKISLRKNPMKELG